MELYHEKKGDNLIITIKGHLDTGTTPEAEKAIRKILEEGNSRILFNFSDLEYLSSVGLRVILWVTKEIASMKGKLVLCSLNQYVKEIFEVSGFDSLIPIEETVESGLEKLNG